MKNTKHTEMNDSSIEQDNQENLSQSKRKILTSIGVTSGVVGASALVPSTWVKPAVNSVILPAHAQSTPEVTTAGPGETTAGPGETTAGPGETTAGPEETTAGPEETTEAPAAGIVLSTMAITLTEGVETDPPDTDSYMVSLATMPEEEVVVTVTQSADKYWIQGGITRDADGYCDLHDGQTGLYAAGSDGDGRTAVKVLQPQQISGGETVRIYHSVPNTYANVQDAVATVTVVDEDVFLHPFGETNVELRDVTHTLTAAEGDSCGR